MYNHKKIEKKWQRKWRNVKLYQTATTTGNPKYYALDMFPYPSGAGLHVGHPKGYIATDVVARFKMLNGFNVLHPMGWDAFGLPAENYAIKNKIHPKLAVKGNIKRFKKQLKILGFTYDWNREINTTDPRYYKWTQWIFLQMFKRGLVYESDEPINWCPSCKTGMANEDIENSLCERCGSEIEQKPVRQLVLRITDYAERLLDGLKDLNWEDAIIEMQKNWIGKSEGAEVYFEINNKKIKTFTTRPDTLFGATYIVLAPEHPLVQELKNDIKNWPAVENYINNAQRKSSFERIEINKEKTGVEIKGVKAINPANNEKIPVYIADYVMMSYGAGAIMAVPAHDERDFEFAQKYNLPIKKVVKPNLNQLKNSKKRPEEERCFSGEGININSGFLNNLKTDKAKQKMIDWLKNGKLGRKTINYKLRDWVFSRQRYWGEPIPLIHCEKCKKKRLTYIILHGYGALPQTDFYSWLTKELTQRGHRVFCPRLPNTDQPLINEQVNYVLRRIKLNKDTAIIGHSLGGAVALKIAEQSEVQIDKVVLIDSFIEPKFNDMARPAVKRSGDWRFDFAKIKDNIREIVILADKNCPVIPKEQTFKMAQNFGVEPIFWSARGWHFCGDQESLISRLLANQGIYPVPENRLPLKLPEMKRYEPTGTGESPLANIKKWVNTTCPKCGGPAKRETNTMPQWAGSCWYYLRYIDPKNNRELVNPEKEKYWQPVDLYVGGAEHATRHLIYARFWHKFLYDIGVVSTSEPFVKLQHVGLIMAEDGRKMSKRWNNVINPDEIIKKYGADAMRVYEMFMGPFENAIAWSTKSLIGARRFLDKIYRLEGKIKNRELKPKNKKLKLLLHKTIKKVTEDIGNFKFNTAISALMILANEMEKAETLFAAHYSLFVILLSPFAPHLAEELWEKLGHKESIFSQSWPKYDPELTKDEKIELVIQINGKVRDKIIVRADISEARAKKNGLTSEKIKKWLNGEKPKRVIYIKGKLVNIVI